MIYAAEYSNEDFNSLDFSDDMYEACIFKGCNFSSLSLSLMVFEDCTFIECNFSELKADQTAFRTCEFQDCKILAAIWDNANSFLLKLNFTNCILDYSTFSGLPLKGSQFVNCSMLEVDFSKADLQECNFTNSQLSRATFNQSDLRKSDFSQSIDFSIDPEINQINNAIFSRDDLGNLLHKHNITIK